MQIPPHQHKIPLLPAEVYYKCFLHELYHDDVECIIEDNRVITPLGSEGKALEERGRNIGKKLLDAVAVYLWRDGEIIILKNNL